MHPSHYGRMCPIETPEGPNIGLIGYLVDATRGSTGSASSRRRTARSTNGVATDDIEYLAADDEDRYVIAQANAAVDDKGRFLDDKVLVRAAPRRGRVRRPARGRLHGRVAEADRLGGDRAHPVPRARRRQPRAHGRQHAAPGRPAAAADRAVHRHRRRGPRGPRRGRRHPRQGRRHGHRRHRRHDRRRLRGQAGPHHAPALEVPPLEPGHLHQPEAAGRHRRHGHRRATSSPTARRPTRASSRSARTSSWRSCRGRATTTRTRSSSPSGS